MRIHALEITGFGPFAATERIDVDALAADGLFLLHGQTGAGKTTVLDAIAFALYGTVPGARRDGKRLRSDHAAPGTPTEVRLEATIGGRRLRIRRSPEYMRPKKRGTGETKENAKATLEWVDGGGVNLSRIDEIGSVVRGLLGMSAEQFFQVVLLPQGEFARFLKAETGTRAALLEKLFDTARFSDIESWFVERRREGAAGAQEARRSVELAVGALAAAAGGPAAAEPRDDADGAVRGEHGAHGAPGRDAAASGPGGSGAAADPEPAESPPSAGAGDADGARDDARDDRHADPVAWAGRLQELAAADASAQADRRAACRREAEDARALADRERARAVAQRRRADALAAVERYEEAEPDRARAAAELEAARRAEQAGWAEAARKDAEVRSDEALRRLRSAASALTADDPHAARALGPVPGPRPAAETRPGAEPAEVPQPAAMPDPSGLERLLEDRDAELVRLQAAERDESALEGLLQRRDELHDAVQRLDARADALAEESDVIPARIDEVRRIRLAAFAAEESLPRLGDELTVADAVAAAAAALPEARETCSRAEKDLSAAAAERDAARAHALDVRERRLNGIAAELAGALSDGDPCAVCGSLQHPRPAAARADRVTEDDEAQATRQWEAAATRCEDRRRALTRAQSEAAITEERAGGVEADSAAQRRADAERALAQAREAASGLAEAERRLTELERKRDEARSAADVLATDRTRRSEELAGTHARIEDLQRRVRAVVGSGDSARALSEDLRRRRDGVTGILALIGEARSAAGELERASLAVREAAAAGGFGDVAGALAAVRPHSRCERIESDLAAARQEAAGARAVLDEPEVRAEEGAQAADEDGSAARAADAESRLEAAVVAHANAAARRESVDAHAAAVVDAVGALGPVLERQRWLSDLTDVIIGDGENARRMSLRSYVLAARLEEVSVVASQRLRRMSDGRYEFVHTEATVRRERRGGLGLDILDANTGTVRPTSTLSGGETFMASLSLALGLADVVSEEAGGITLDTLFIDEGFGTLDAESLDMVMGVLDELRSGGRAVGIVSHVAEMRQRIPNRLHVIKGERGSAIRMTGAG